MAEAAWLRTVTVMAVALGGVAAGAGLFWEPPGDPVAGRSDLYGLGLYQRDTAFTAGGAQGSDLLTLVVVPAALWAAAGRFGRRRILMLAAVHSWLLYLGASLSFGAIAFNELFPLYVVLVPLSSIGLVLAVRGLGAPPTPRWLPPFLLACGIATGAHGRSSCGSR